MILFIIWLLDLLIIVINGWWVVFIFLLLGFVRVLLQLQQALQKLSSSLQAAASCSFRGCDNLIHLQFPTNNLSSHYTDGEYITHIHLQDAFEKTTQDRTEFVWIQSLNHHKMRNELIGGGQGASQVWLAKVFLYYSAHADCSLRTQRAHK